MVYRQKHRLSFRFDCGMTVYMPSSSAPSPADIKDLEEVAENAHHVECGCGAT